MKTPKPPAAPVPAAVSTANSADVAGDAAAARKKTGARYDFSKTLLRSGSQYMPEGVKTTLG